MNLHPTLRRSNIPPFSCEGLMNGTNSSTPFYTIFPRAKNTMIVTNVKLSVCYISYALGLIINMLVILKLSWLLHKGFFWRGDSPLLETTCGIGLQYLPTNPSPTSPSLSCIVNLHIYPNTMRLGILQMKCLLNLYIMYNIC